VPHYHPAVAGVAAGGSWKRGSARGRQARATRCVGGVLPLTAHRHVARSLPFPRACVCL